MSDDIERPKSKRPDFGPKATWGRYHQGRLRRELGLKSNPPLFGRSWIDPRHAQIDPSRILTGLRDRGPNLPPVRFTVVSDYSLIDLTVVTEVGSHPLAKVLVTNAQVGGYSALQEAWRFSESGVGLLGSAIRIKLQGTGYVESEDPLEERWFPPEPGFVPNELIMPTDVDYVSVTGTPSVSRVFETSHAMQDFPIRLGLDLKVEGDEVTGTIAWFHQGPPAFADYLVPAGFPHVFELEDNPSWSGPWKQYVFSNP